MRPGATVTIVLTALALVACGGCGKEAGPYVGATVPVKGKITYHGKPLTQGSITFEPDNGREAHGSIQSDGTFTLSTFKEGDGAIAGVHRIGVQRTGKGGKEVLPVKFRYPSSSKVEVEVKEGTTDYSINLK